MLPKRWEGFVLLIGVWVYAVRFLRTKQEDRPKFLIADAWIGLLNWLMWWLVLFVPVLLLSMILLWLFKRL